MFILFCIIIYSNACYFINCKTIQIMKNEEVKNVFLLQSITFQKMFMFFVIYLAVCKAINTTSFTYSIQNYIGIVGEAIKTNSPQQKIIGSFSSNLNIPGIEIDKRTGLISGVPLKAFNGFVIVTYVDRNSGEAYTSQIHLTSINFSVLKYSIGKSKCSFLWNIKIS